MKYMLPLVKGDPNEKRAHHFIIFIQRNGRIVSKYFGVTQLTYLLSIFLSFFFFFSQEVLVTFHVFDSYVVFEKFQGILHLRWTVWISWDSLLIAFGMRFSEEKMRCRRDQVGRKVARSYSQLKT